MFKPKAPEENAFDEQMKELDDLGNPEEELVLRKVTKMELDDYIVFD